MTTPKEDKRFQSMMDKIIADARNTIQPEIEKVASLYASLRLPAEPAVEVSSELERLYEKRIRFFYVCAIPAEFDHTHRRAVLEEMRAACETPTGKALIRAHPDLFSVADKEMIRSLAEYKRANPKLWDLQIVREKLILREKRKLRDAL